MNRFWILRGRGGLAVRWKGFSCHLLSHIRRKGPIYDTDVISELHVLCPIPFFLLDLFPKLLFSYPPTFLTCWWPLSLTDAAHVFCCLLPAFSAPHRLYFSESILRSHWWKCVSGKCLPFISWFLSGWVSSAQLEAHSKSTAEQTVHRLAQQREVFVLGFLTMSVSALWKGSQFSRGYVLAPLKSPWSQCFVTWDRYCTEVTWGVVKMRLVLKTVEKNPQNNKRGGKEADLEVLCFQEASHLLPWVEVSASLDC